MPDRISLIIPVKNEEDSIAKLLDSVIGQSLTPDEVVITDGGSIDGTDEIIESYKRKGMPIQLIKANDSYPGKARNIAIKNAKYDMIAMTDAGIKLDKNWLKYLYRCVEEDNGVDVVYGNYEPVTDSFFKECLAVAFVPAPKLINGKKMRSHFIASSLMRKKVWESVGGFPDFRAAEDRIFMEKIKKGRFKTAYAPEATVLWDIPSNFSAVFKRFFLYSMHDIKAGRWRDWHQSVLVMYAFGLIIALLGVFNSPLWFILLLVGLASRALGLIFERRKDASLSDKLSIRGVTLVTAIMVWIDIAMFCGIVDYFKHKLFGKE
ncbi:MAG: glycosyltransferase [Candidatus Omnitrophota bacterium]|jgi:glycosyltransferase involved in cell wall biosynthesis